MADLFKNFQSQTDIKATQEEKRKARQQILENARRKFELNEAKREKARLQGEGTWMLDSVSERINKEEKAQKKAKKKSKKKKKKKDKKKKSHSSSSSGTDSEDGNEDTWVEKGAEEKGIIPHGVMKGPRLQREGWMEAPLDLIPTTSRQEIREAINKEKEEARKAAEAAQQPGQHARELNPYWRDGGTGVPDKDPRKEKKGSVPQLAPASAAAPSGDGGFSWLQKAYTRCQQQAEEEGRSLEEVAAERWGSLKKLKKMLAEAREKNSAGFRCRDSSLNESHKDWMRPEQRSKRTVYDEREGQGRGSRDDEDRDRRDGRRYGRETERHRGRERSGSRERREDRGGSRERGYERAGATSGSRGHKEEDKGGGRDTQRSRFRRPGSDDEEQSSGKGQSSSSRSSLSFRKPGGEETDGREKRKTFMRPSDSDDRDAERWDGMGRERQHGRRRSRTPERGVPRWKKKAETGSEQSESIEVKHERHNVRDKAQLAKEDERRRRRVRKSRSSSSSASSSSGGSNSDQEQKSDGEDDQLGNKDEPQPPKVMSEAELNELAAKILRAEIMGEDELAADLKSKLEAARQQREDSKTSGALQQGRAGPDFSYRRRREDGGGGRSKGSKEGDGDGGEEVVVLSRTSKGGLVRPVWGAAGEHGGFKPGQKRKKKTASTHDVSGLRTIYFDDDNKYDLKSLVEQERAGTAEDQNAMFARLAGGKLGTNEEVDDMIISKAARKQNEEAAASRDRSAAIFEHRKVSAAMEKCSRCFDKVPKHLIVAIGTKSYLCLPYHRSLTEGHCLIVPMQHVVSGTSMDEDVWREMQMFRKSLVQMFLAEDEDVVVMETVMHLKSFPHTAIECVPLPRETGDLAPIYFKKAIQEAGPEWADNKKLHSLREKDVRHVIPKGFPYFSVDFGLQGGYATVIEDEQTFPSYFGREIVGGMIDAEPALWRKPHKESFEDQRKKVLKFEARWRGFDWTRDMEAI